MRPNRLNLANQKYGNLDVISWDESKKLWLCKCSCNNYRLCNSKKLRDGSIKYCKDCSILYNRKRLDLSNKRFGSVIALKEKLIINKDSKYNFEWECLCDCGEICFLTVKKLKSKYHPRCQSCKIKKRNERYFYHEIPSSYIKRIKDCASKRGLKYNLDEKFLWDLFLKQNKKCAISGLDINFDTKHYSKDTTASLDRINNDIGYEENNVHWVHKLINKFKLDWEINDFYQLCQICVNHKLMQERPSFDEYFMNIAFAVSSRSEDMFIKHGSVLVDNKSKHIIGTGYNGLIKGFNKNDIDLYDRDKRRQYMTHSEANCILNASKNPLENGTSTLYVTGLPCVNCLLLIINFGVNKIIYADRNGTITESEETKEIRNTLIKASNIEFCKISLNNPWISRNIITVPNNLKNKNLILQTDMLEKNKNIETT